MASSYLALGYQCNHKCLCCPLTTYDRLHKPLDFEEIKNRIELIRDVNNSGLQEADSQEHNHIVLSGGEPMLHKDFLKIVEFLAGKGFYITVLTNSSQCKERMVAKAIRNVMPAQKFDIITAIHSSSVQIHDRITGVPGSLLETLEGLDNLVSEDVPVTIKHIFNKISLPFLLETFQYLEQHFPPKVSFQFCTMDYSGMAEKNVKDLFVTMPELQHSVEETLDYLETRMSRKRSISFIETPLCMTDPYYWKYFNTKSNGVSVYIAPNTEEAKAVYDVKSECGAYFAPCKECAVQKWCPGTWISAYKYCQNGLLSPVLKID